MESFKSEEYEDYINLFRELERKKQTIRSDAESKVVINLPVSLLDLVKQTHKRVTEVIEQSPYKEAVTNSKQKMYISPNTFRDLCKPTIRAVIKHIKTIHKDQTANDINILMIVGELSEGKMVQDAMHKYFGESKTVIIPNEAGMAILKGAVLFAFQPMHKGTHTAKYTYGVKCWSDWNPELYPASKEVIINDKSKCKDIFYTLLSKEDTFTTGFTVSTIISVATNSRNTFDCLIFISSNLKPRFTTDPSCKQLSHIKVLLPAQYKDNEIEVMLTFWDDEILVRTKELKSGKMYEQYIEYQDISNEDTSDVMLLDELRGLGLEYVSDLNELLTDSSQKSFWNRIYLVGPYNVGKTCLAKLLVGEAVTKTRQSTDGIWIYMGRAGMDVDKMEWVFFPKGNAIKEVVTNMLMSMTFADTQQSFTKESISLTEKVPTPQHLSSTHGDNKEVSIDVHHDKTNTNQGISTETNYLGNVSRSQNEEIVHSKTLPSKEMNNQHDELKENAADVEYEMEVSSSDDTKIELFSDNVMSEEKDQSDDSDNQSSESDYPMFQYDSNESTAESLCENEEQNVASNRSIKFKPNEINIPSNDQLSDITVLSSGSDTSLEYQVNESKTPEMQTDGQVVTDNSQCEWLEEIITDMSHDKIHQLLVKAVQEGEIQAENSTYRHLGLWRSKGLLHDSPAVHYKQRHICINV
ncbi:Hypothetical predicted protein [Mytilus galloprovincialis]|uniref:Uncharacterized protein n=1 Tax=Mytilus galloprovincialis TaxID=29158 RepID=A0A8B6DBZ1_MYTGA|nr:Hypothetical predicted protein [Mytilus galloprovincialis]